ncbi:nucleotidyl transferase AbiEii/AbiGii toxin family protein [Verminephrobacter eiseniae]|uniref:nucleotidyl transferase AbiEii/AbiGii toxin family protein n=1 Tax=Verminephrobacter eiseniae TaxID=364317 RepID=UPI001E387C31|nr:nucleotidyl transferase AbiEii/AbiGii toxin family protein [Verminephrobacter eiseniae]
MLDRMSEDVDYKLVPTPETMVLSNGKRRAALGDFAKAAIDALQAGRFGQGSVERRSRNANAYTRLDVSYESAFSKPAALRGHLLVEFNHSPLRLEPDKRLVGLLLDKLALGAYTDPFEVECIALQEALTEKLVSFPRRLSMLLARHSDPARALGCEADGDSSLVRHLYDARRLLQVHPELAEDGAGLAKLVDAAVRQDMAAFANQHPEFVADPGLELLLAMKFAKASPDLAAQFDAFVSDQTQFTLAGCSWRAPAHRIGRW